MYFEKSEYQFVGPWVQIIPGYEEGGFILGLLLII